MQTKEISFEYEGAKYTLAFTRKTVQTLSQNGFRPEMITEQPAVGIPMLFRGAFMVHHRNIKFDLVDRIYNDLENKTELINNLLTMYIEPITEMLEDPEDSSKKVKWEMNF